MKTDSGDFFIEDTATQSLIAHWCRVRESAINITAREALTWADDVAISVGEAQSAPAPDILFRATVVQLSEKVPEGQMIVAVMNPFFEIIAAIERDAELILKLPWRKLEEMIAGAYERAGWCQVILTPRSRDRGRDIIATSPGFVSIRIFDQVKRYKSSRLVSADEIRSMLGVLQTSPNVSKGIVTTTSGFAPGITKDDEFKGLIPYRLELRDGVRLREWLVDLAAKRSRHDLTSLLLCAI